MKKLVLTFCFCMCLTSVFAQIRCNATSEMANALMSQDTIDKVTNAAKANNLPALKKAIENSNNNYLAANVYASVTGRNRTPLMWACIKGNFEMAKYLVEKGACVDTTDMYDNTALGYALEFKRPKTINLLILKGAEVDRNMLHDADSGVGTKMPLLAVALRNGFYEVSKLILRRDTRKSILNQTYDDDTLLELAVYKGYFDLVKVLHVRGEKVTTYALSGAGYGRNMDLFRYLASQPEVSLDIAGVALCRLVDDVRPGVLPYVKTLVETFRRTHGNGKVRELVNYPYTLNYKQYSPLSIAARSEVKQYLQSLGARYPGQR